MSGFIDISEINKNYYNKIVTHPLQSYEWGEFRKKTGVKVVRRALVKDKKIVDGFTVTIHPIPKLPWTIGYIPKGNSITIEIVQELERIGKKEKCIFIQLEPNIEVEIGQLKVENEILNSKVSSTIPSAHPLFTKYTFVLDISKSEEDLLKNMHPKTRYNIRVAEKHGVKITFDPPEQTFKKYLELTKETTTRQKFYAHTPLYHEKMWETLQSQKSETKNQNFNILSAHLLTAEYGGKTLNTWVLFVFHDTLYYPYGASSSEHRNVMASNLIMWEAIKFGQKLGLKKFDMWGALGPEPDANNPWFGFHKFKQGYGAQLTEFIGSYDLVINPLMYQLYKAGDKLRWAYLGIRK